MDDYLDLDPAERQSLDNWAAESWDRVTLMGPEDGFYDRGESVAGYLEADVGDFDETTGEGDLDSPPCETSLLAPGLWSQHPPWLAEER